MGLAADYDIYRDNAAMSCVIHTGSGKIYGTGSLEMKYVSAGTNINVVRKNTPKGFTSGRARFLLGHTIAGSQLSGARPAFLFNLSQDDMTGSSGTGYSFGIVKSGGTNQFTCDFRRMSAGMPTSTLLTSASTFTLGVSPLSVPLEVTWRLDVENLGGMELSARRGAVANYDGTAIDWDSVLTTALITGYIDTSYLSVSQGEGPSLRETGAVLDAYYWDQMSVVPLLTGGTTT